MGNFIKTFIAPYAKAITAAIVGGVLVALNHGGLHPGTEVVDAITVLVGAGVTGGLTWLVKNTPSS